MRIILRALVVAVVSAAWNTLIDQPWKIMSIARRDWVIAGQYCEDWY